MRHWFGVQIPGTNKRLMPNLMPGLNKMSQFLLTALFAVALSFLTFAASFAEVPRSELVPVAASQQ